MALNEAEITALTRAFEAKIRTAAASAVPDGSEHDINVVVRVSGKLQRRDTPAKTAPSSNIPWMAVCATLITRLGAHKDFSRAWVIDIITQAALADKEERAALLKETGAEAALKALKGEVDDNVPFRDKRGTLETILKVEVLECAAIRLAASETA